jgi:hypothetical protein
MNKHGIELQNSKRLGIWTKEARFQTQDIFMEKKSLK